MNQPELYLEIPGQLVLVDVHDVVADFVGGAHRLWEQEYNPWACDFNFWRDWENPPNDEEFWEAVNSRGAKFWAQLDPLPTGLRLVEELSQMDSEWAFITAGVEHPGGYDGTLAFLQHWFGDCRLIGTAEKHLLAGPNRLLIDDRVDFCEKFREAGGCSFTWPRPHNVGYMLEGLCKYTRAAAIQEVLE